MAAPEITLFSGGYVDDHDPSTHVWAARAGAFATFGGDGHSLVATASEVIADDPHAPLAQRPSHAEAQRIRFIGVDFTYSAAIDIAEGAEAHLQFRISDRGRYGVLLSPTRLTFYVFTRPDRECKGQDATVFTHCPDWPLGYLDHRGNPVSPGDIARFPAWQVRDEPQWIPLFSEPLSLPPGSRHELAVRTLGSLFEIFLDGARRYRGEIANSFFSGTPGERVLPVGRFGVYVLGRPDAIAQVGFRDVTARADPTLPSNFALLYSTPGYELAGTKRALVRSLNDVPPRLVDPGRSRFRLTRTGGASLEGPLSPLPTPRGRDRPAKTFGMQLWEADFSSVTTPGTYRLSVELATSTGFVTLSSSPFEIQPHLLSRRVLRQLSILNAAARRGADEDLRRNWCFETAAGCTNHPAQAGAWSVAVDGAFWADRADATRGAVLRRVFDGYNAVLEGSEFRFLGHVTIVSGCDAQLQFWITPTERWGVTLQAGEGGGCPFGGGPGAVRLHQEVVAPPVFNTVAASIFPAEQPFVAGRTYELEVLVRGGGVTVYLDGVALPGLVNVPIGQGRGGFGLKAWAATVRFDHVQAWHPGVRLARSPGGSRVPYFPGTLFAFGCQGSVVVPPLSAARLDADEVGDANLICNPLFSQLHGFHDANNIIAEATSHGSFLAGLMEVWTRRAAYAAPADRESLRRAIQAAALYLEELYQQGAATGEFAHSETGRRGINENLGLYQHVLALYGMSAFAELGVFVDRALALQACQRAVAGIEWLRNQPRDWNDPAQQSVILTRVARCAEREHITGTSDPAGTPIWQTYRALASQAAAAVIQSLTTNGFAAIERDTGKVIPSLEGVFEMFREQAGPGPALTTVADALIAHLAQPHRCAGRAGRPCPPNGFFVIPQASGLDAARALVNWTDMESVPLVNRPTSLPYVHFYEGSFFATAASDVVFLAELTGSRGLEPVASGNLYWLLGLNPGLPASKVVGGEASVPWQAAAFIYNLDAPFARTMEAWRTNLNSAKGFLAPWEVNAASPHRETWIVDPSNNGFQSIVNGHVLWDGQWDYWNSGANHNWSSGETFIRNDGTFLKAALLFEDWLNGAPAPRLNPYDTGRLAFFDTTHVDRNGTTWGFDDPDRTAFAIASRAATNFCVDKAFGGGRFTGHFVGERLGVLCVPTTARFFDATETEITATGWGFDDINTAPWAQTARAATDFCGARGFAGGFFTGHQLDGRRGIVCLAADAARWFDSTEAELAASGHGFGDINAVSWARAARAATNICLGKGYGAGFFTGHQVPGLRGVVCLAS